MSKPHPTLFGTLFQLPCTVSVICSTFHKALNIPLRLLQMVEMYNPNQYVIPVFPSPAFYLTEFPNHTKANHHQSASIVNGIFVSSCPNKNKICESCSSFIASTPANI